MRLILIWATVLLASCSQAAQYLPEVSIETGKIASIMDKAKAAMEAADLDKNGKIEGREESTALWKGLLEAFKP